MERRNWSGGAGESAMPSARTNTLVARGSPPSPGPSGGHGGAPRTGIGGAAERQRPWGRTKGRYSVVGALVVVSKFLPVVAFGPSVPVVFLSGCLVSPGKPLGKAMEDEDEGREGGT